MKLKILVNKNNKSTYISLFLFQTNKWGFIGTHLLKEELNLNLSKKDCSYLIRAEFETQKKAVNALNTILNKY